MRVHLALRRMSLREADLLEYDLKGVCGVTSVKVFDWTQDAVITYTYPRADVVRALASFSFTSERAISRLPEHTSRALNREYEDKLVFTVCRRAFSRLFLPIPVRTAIALFRSVKYIRAGLSALLHGRLSVAVLDATAVTVSMVRGDFDTAGSVMFMLRLGEILEEWTHKKSVADLAGAMALNVDKVWLQSGGTELLVPIGDVKPGDRMIVRTGNLIPLDGRVVSGEATVNQASITGESMPAPKRDGSYVYAGTVVEEGECVVCVEKVLIGSAHFVFEDEGCTIPDGERKKFDFLPAQYSHLYLCIAGELAAVICIFDPLRAEAKDAIRALHACGISKVVMMTGDNRRTAASVAAEVGVDEFYAEVLPEDKAAFIRREKAAGRTVIMIGDGVNDSPALSEADAGVAISTGAAIAREIADITIASEDLFELVTLRRIAEALMGRIHRNYRFIVGFNLGLIVFGVAGLLPPTTSALLHNASTLAISLKSMTNLLPDKKKI